MKLRRYFAELASQPLHDRRLRALARALVPPRFHERTRRTVEAAIQPDAGRDLELFRAVLAERPAPDGIAGRAALVCGSLGPGGAQRQVVNTLHGLARAGLTDLHLLCDHVHGDTNHRYDFYLPRAVASGASVRAIRPDLHETVGPGSLPPAFAAHFTTLHPVLAANTANLYWELKELRPTVVHAWIDWTNVSAGIAAALAGVPRIILSGRNVGPHRFEGYASFMASAYQALCDVPGVSLVNNSQAGADDYAAWLGIDAGSIRVIYNGVDCSDATADASGEEQLRQQLDIPPQAEVLGGMFRFQPEKRPLLWLQVAAAVAALRPDTWFVIFGQGEMRPEMEAEARRLGLAGRLRMPGVTSSPFAALRAMDVLLLTSAWEGTPNVALEAQSCGVPVVATRAGGSVEAVAHGETGWIVEASDPPSIAERVVATLDDSAVGDRLRTAGPRFVAERFGLDRMIDETLRIYGHAAPAR